MTVGKDWAFVSSSNLDAVKYDAEQQRLSVRFKHGGVYAYDGVPQDVVEAMVQATSPGKYFNENIQDRYDTGRE